MNEPKEHLIDDIERLCHEEANLDIGIIIYLYRLSAPGAKISNRDWSSNSPRILSKENILKIAGGKPVDIYYGLYDSTGKYESGAWLIQKQTITPLG